MTTGTSSNPPTTPDSPASRADGLPFAAVLGVLAGLSIAAVAVTPLRDIDVFWHVLAGRELLAGVPADAVGQQWSFAPDPLPWTSTQWVTEVIFAWLQDLGDGWAGPAAFRVATAAVAVAVLAVTTLRGRARAVAGFPFLLATAMTAFVSQDRPQQFTLIGAAVLGGVLVAGLVEQRLPRWWILLPATVVWANLHGGWVLVPAVLALVALGVSLDHGLGAPAARRAGLLALAGALAGCLTPSGLAGLTAPLRFSSATALIREWTAVSPVSALGWFTLAMLALFVLGWSASRELPRSEAVVVLVLLTFTWMANRNLAPGLALLAPLSAHRLCTAFPSVGRPEPRWSVPVGIGLATVLALVGVASVWGRDNLPYETQPLRLARQLAELPAGQRVLNDYNTSGAALFFGGPQTVVAIDGRTDRYGADYIGRYVDLLALRGDWEPLFDELAPTAALLEQDSPLGHVLVAERGWRQVGEPDAGYVLLVRPAAASERAASP